LVRAWARALVRALVTAWLEPCVGLLLTDIQHWQHRSGEANRKKINRKQTKNEQRKSLYLFSVISVHGLSLCGENHKSYIPCVIRRGSDPTTFATDVLVLDKAMAALGPNLVIGANGEAAPVLTPQVNHSTSLQL